MNKTEFIKSVSDKSGATMKAVREVLGGIEETVFENIKIENDVPLIRGLIVSSEVRPARIGRNPRTGEPLEIPEKRVPKIKVGKALKAAAAE